MSDQQASAEVAEDYKSSLEFLVHNDRYAINNLTVIAKENTAHAEAISRVLEEHIRKVGSIVYAPCYVSVSQYTLKHFCWRSSDDRRS